MAEEQRIIGKIIKKAGRWLLRIVIVLVVLLISTYFLVQLPAVQTWLAQRATSWLSDELETKVEVKGVNIQFFTKAVFEGIYVEDKHGDTLLYAEELIADVRRFSYENHQLALKDIKLSNANIKLKKYANERGLNYRFILMHFKSTGPKKSKTKSPWDVELGGITLDNVRIAYIDTRDTIADPGMDYENILATGVYAHFEDIRPAGDSVQLHLDYLRAREQCGFEVKEFESELTLSEEYAHFRKLKIATPSSLVKGDLKFVYDSLEAIEDDFIHLVRMQGHLDSTQVEMADIAYFSPDLEGIHEKVLVSGDVSGTVERLRCKNIRLEFGRNSVIAGNFSFNGLPDIETTDMNFRIRELRTSYYDLGSLPNPPFPKGDSLLTDLPAEMAKLGTIGFTGTYEGFLSEFVAHGRFTTALGNLNLDNLAMSQPDTSSLFVYHGRISPEVFDVGNLFDVAGLGTVSGTIDIDGSGLRPDIVDADVNGQLSAVAFNNYTYRNIAITNGHLYRGTYDIGQLEMRDPNVQLSFSGMVNFKDKVPVMNFTADIDSANLGALGFLNAEEEHILTTGLEMRLKGSNIDNMTGTIGVQQLDYVRNGEQYSFRQLTLNAQNFENDSTRIIALESDIATATIKGRFQLLELPATVENLLSDYLPSYFPPPAPIDPKKKKAKTPEQKFTYYLTFNQNTRPVEVLAPGLAIKPGTFLKGSFDTEKRHLDGLLDSDGISWKGTRFEGLHNITFSNTARRCELNGRMNRIALSDSVGLNNVLLKCSASNDSLLTRLDWNNQSRRRNEGQVILLTHFLGGSALSMQLFNASLYLNDSLWQVAGGNQVLIDSNRIEFKNLRFSSGNQLIGLNGVVSDLASDQLLVSLNKFNLYHLNYFTEASGLSFSGFISGQTTLSDLYRTPIFTSNTEFTNLFINGQKLGEGHVDAVWDKVRTAVYMHGEFSKGIKNEETNSLVNNIIFEGYYFPKRDENSLDIDLSLYNIDLGILQPLLKEYCSRMVGTIGGKVHVAGTLNKPEFAGSTDVFIKKATIDYLGIDVKAFEQKVYIEPNSFYFDDYQIADKYGNKAKIYGHLYHSNFSNFQFDMDFALDKFLVMDTKEKDNELYFGTVFATGFMNIFGFVDDKISININAKTESIVNNGSTIRSVFNIPMSYTSEVGENDFVYFAKDSVAVKKMQSNQFKNNGIEMSLTIEATEDADVNVIFDKTVGDEIKAVGTGVLDMNLSEQGDFTMKGQYQVSSGKYLFTLKNIIYAPFELARGGTISWSGDPEHAIIDADAVYKANASVEPFFPLDSVNQAYKRAYPVNVVMHLDSNLMNPNIGFDIELPTADQNIQETVKSYTQIELERNKQVLSLIVLNSFITPSEFRDGASNSNVVGGTSSTILSNFVSGTLNNWLSQISNDFSVQMKYRPNDDVSQGELKLYMQTAILNNRVTIDGNFGREEQTQLSSASSVQWVGDVNVEYKVTDDGRVRLRAFNRSNDNTLINATAPFTQGVGVFYREDFDSFHDLMVRYKAYLFTERVHKTEVAPEPPKVDTTRRDSLPPRSN
jgi:TamB, inner membrane protein subunit of TAM complex